MLLSRAIYKDHTKLSKLAHLFQRALREAVFLQVKIMFHWGEKRLAVDAYNLLPIIFLKSHEIKMQTIHINGL